MDYCIATASSIDSLPSSVKRYIAQGWEPHGSPFPLHTIGYYAQAMVRRNQNTRTSLNQSEQTAETLSPQDIPLMNSLKEERIKIAAENGVPAYCILTNKTLMELIKVKPKTIDELKTVYGFGPKKVELYGDKILRAMMV